MSIKIGVLSDTHLNGVNDSLEDIYDQYLEDTDMILHAGDFVSVEVVRFLGSEKQFHGVCGNMDTIDVRDTLPPKKVIEVGPFNIGLMHGWGAKEGLEERLMNEFTGVDAIVYGHSHRPANHIKEGILFFNPGSVAGRSLMASKSIGILEVGEEISGRIINL